MLSLSTNWAAAQSSTPLPREQTSNRLVLPTPDLDLRNHPLQHLVDYAKEKQAYLRTVRDFTCRVIKRERIEGELRKFEHINMWVQEEVREGDRTLEPLKVFLEFIAPPEVAGRKVLYIDGQNEGKMLVRKGGRRFNYLIVRVDPNGDAASSESLVPITEIGFDRMLARMIRVLQDHMKIDPAAHNTRVEKFVRAKINGRLCTVFRVTHPQKQTDLHFHISSVYIDDELQMPVRIDAYDWPEQAGQRPPLLAEYTYTNLRLNVGLSPAVFNPKRVTGD